MAWWERKMSSPEVGSGKEQMVDDTINKAAKTMALQALARARVELLSEAGLAVKSGMDTVARAYMGAEDIIKKLEEEIGK